LPGGIDEDGKTHQNSQYPDQHLGIKYENYGVTYTWCIKENTTAKLNSTEMNFWRSEARISRKDKIRNNVI
jgi:hypothetical protein